jgi:hypothetical protein
MKLLSMRDYPQSYDALRSHSATDVSELKYYSVEIWLGAFERNVH